MAHPNYTADSSRHLPNAGYCASDIVVQTAAVVITERGYVLLLEDIETGITGLPRSHVPHCLDSLVEAPLAFLSQTGYRIEPLPLRTPIRLQTTPEQLVNGDELELAFAKHASTTPFCIALDLAYFDSSNLERLADGRQSVVLWHAGILRGRLPDITPLQRRLARFVPLREAVDEIQEQPLHDCVAVRALRLFQKIMEETEVIPRELVPSKPISDEDQHFVLPRYIPHENDTHCYPASMMPDPIFPPATPNSTGNVSHTLWSAADYIVRTGAVILDQTQGLVLSGPGLLPNSPITLPRSTRDNVNELLCAPLGDLSSMCSRLPLPRLTKYYRYIDGQDEPEAETRALSDTTTDPFFVTFRTWWDHKARTLRGSLGRQEITFWYTGAFDASQGLPLGYVALPIKEALDRLLRSDTYAWSALQLCLDVLGDSPNTSSESTPSQTA